MVEHLTKFNSGLSNKVWLMFQTLLLEGVTYAKNDDCFSRVGIDDLCWRPRGRRAAENAAAAEGARVAQTAGRRLGPGHSDAGARQGHDQVQRDRKHPPHRRLLVAFRS